jgi:hypothetical protein
VQPTGDVRTGVLPGQGDQDGRVLHRGVLVRLQVDERVCRVDADPPQRSSRHVQPSHEGKHRHPCGPSGVAPPAVRGRQRHRGHIHIWKVADGMIVEHWAGRDDSDLLSQSSD